MKNEIRYVVVLGLICAVSAAVLAGVYSLTKEPIEASRRAVTLEAIQMVLPEDVTPDAEPLPSPAKEQEEVEASIYAARRDGQIAGGAVEVVTNEGYGPDMKVMVGLILPQEQGRGGQSPPENGIIIHAVRVLSHRETPGLGTKVTEESFLRQFRKLTVPYPASLRINKEPGGTIVGETGVTISSKALTGAVNMAVDAFVERLGAMAAAAATEGES